MIPQKRKDKKARGKKGGKIALFINRTNEMLGYSRKLMGKLCVILVFCHLLFTESERR